VRWRREKDLLPTLLVPEENAMNIGPFFGWEAFGAGRHRSDFNCLDEVCSKLGLTDQKKQEEREVLAKRIMALSRHGEHNPAALRDSVPRELAVSAWRGLNNSAVAERMTPPKRCPASNGRRFITSNPDRVEADNAHPPARDKLDFGYNTLPE
jgi:hypothetical protein